MENPFSLSPAVALILRAFSYEEERGERAVARERWRL
jgi:hypothetical protein